MDYIKEINAFYDHDLANQLSQSAGYLYLALLNIANRLFWKEDFMVSDVMLMARSGIKDRRTFKRAIQELVGYKLILVRENRNRSSYTVCGLAAGLPARNAAFNASINATSSAASHGAKDAANDVYPEDAHTWNAALFAENSDDFSKSAASNAASNAGCDASQSPSIEPFGDAQTKPNKLNKTDIPAAAKHAAGIDKTHEPDSSLTAQLVNLYRKAPGVVESKSDCSFIGALINEFSYQAVLTAVKELILASSGNKVQKPMAYLKAILRRAGPGSGPGPPLSAKQSGEEDPLERYWRERYQG